jgi:hypothetical protein
MTEPVTVAGRSLPALGGPQECLDDGAEALGLLKVGKVTRVLEEHPL